MLTSYWPHVDAREAELLGRQRITCLMAAVVMDTRAGGRENAMLLLRCIFEHITGHLYKSGIRPDYAARLNHRGPEPESAAARYFGDVARCRPRLSRTAPLQAQHTVCTPPGTNYFPAPFG